MDRPHAVTALLLAGCAGGVAPGDSGLAGHPGAQLAAEVVSATAAGDRRFADPALAVNGVRGGGTFQGGLDVYRVGTAPGDELVLAFPSPVVDGDGVDLAVFENPFAVRGGGGTFVDPAVVEVSADCEVFVAFPHAYEGGDAYLAAPAAWAGFAGVTPVQLHEEDDPVDPLGPDAGGDGFDLAALADPALADGVVCVRITAAATWTDPATGAAYPADPLSDGPDIDGVYGRE
ncbi:MAG: hypothetical protein R3F59_07760 [Myxococcota bacterium]